MPKTTPTSKKATRTPSPGVAGKPKKSSKLGIILGILCAVVAAVGVAWFMTVGHKIWERQSLESYLEDKYEKDFTVATPSIDPDASGEPSRYTAEAHPADDPSLVFTVGQSNNTGNYFDSYSRTVWEKEELPRVEKFVSELNPPMQNPEIHLSVLIPTAEDPDPIQGVVPGVDEAIRRYANELSYSVNVKMSVGDLRNEKTKSDVRSQYIAVYNFIKGRGIRKPGLSFSVSSLEENMGYGCGASDIERLGSLDAMLTKCLDVPYKKGVY